VLQGCYSKLVDREEDRRASMGLSGWVHGGRSRKGVTRVLQGCYKGVTRVLQSCNNTLVTRV
jgi:hypothetical protein